MIQIVLDDFTPNSQPRELENIEVVISFSYDERVLLTKITDTNFVFTGDAYEYLYSSMRDVGYNGIHDITIQKKIDEQTFSVFFKGKLFISDCEFDLDKRYCEVQITDAGYESYIKNNQSLETNFTTAKSKNGFDLGAITPDTVEMLNPPNNIAGSTFPSPPAFTTTTTRKLYRVEDVLEHLIKFMSDGELSFQSDFLDTIYNESSVRFGIIHGKNLRTNQDLVEGQISFNQLWTDIARLLNMLMTVDNSTGTPTARFEDLPYFQNQDVNFTKQNVSKVKRSFVQELLYGTIVLGSAQSSTDNTKGALTYLPPYDFGNDTYYMAGLSNLDSSLDANAGTLITDSNLIEECIVNDDEANESDWFLIAYKWNDGAAQYEAQTDASDIFADGNYYYNGEFTNKAIVSRYNLQGAAVKMVGDPDGDFIGTRGSDLITDVANIGESTIAAQFNNVIADPSGAWNTTTNRYTAAADGMRNIRVQINHSPIDDWQFTPPYDVFIGNSNQLYVYIIRFRYKLNGTRIPVLIPQSGNQELGYLNDTVVLYSYIPNELITTVDTQSIFLNATDYLEIEYELVAGFLNIKSDGYFEQGNRQIKRVDLPVSKNRLNVNSGDAFASGGDIEFNASSSLTIETQGSMNGIPISTEKQDGFFINRFDFQDTLTVKEIENILNTPQKAIILQNAEHGLNVKSWPYNVSIRLKDGKTTFETFNNINNL